MAKLTLTDEASGYQTTTQRNANYTAIEAAIENTLSRDGSSPNSMLANLDMNSNQLINLGSPQYNTSAARYIDIVDATALDVTTPSQSGNAGRVLRTTGSALVWSSSVYTVASIADMKAIPALQNGEVVHVTGYYGVGTRGGGYFTYNSSSVATPDNGYTVGPDTLSGNFLRVSTQRVVKPSEFGAKGDNVTNDYTALQACFDYAASTGSVVEFDASSYITNTVLTYVDAYPMFKGHGLTIGSQGTVIKYNGSVSASTSVFEIHANTVAILGGYINGVCFDANNKAGFGITYRSTSAAFKQVLLQNSSIMNYTARGLNIVGSGSIELAECFYDNLYIYSYVANAYPVYTSGGTNISRHVFNRTTFAGDSAGKAKNCVYLGNGSGFYFHECLFAQTVSQSGTDGYAIYTAGGYVVINNCWNEANGWLYHGGSDTAQGTTVLYGCHVENTATYSIFFNSAYKNLAIDKCTFLNDIYVGSNSAVTKFNIGDMNFDTGKGVLWDYNGTGSPTLTTGFGKHQLSKETYTHNSGTDFRPNGLADITAVTLNANISNFDTPPINSDRVIVMFTQGATARTVTFNSNYKRAGGGAISVTASAGAIDIFEFVGLGAGVYSLIGEFKNIS